jgi:hypothetical protein
MNTNNFSSSDDEQHNRGGKIRETKQRELFQKTFPTENYDNLESYIVTPLLCDERWNHYINKTTNKKYCWDIWENSWSELIHLNCIYKRHTCFGPL